MREATEYLEFMSRHGLDARVLQEYRQCGMLYYSKRWNDESADLDRFVDFAGVDRSIIRKVDELEDDLSISVYHVIWNSSKEIVLMYVDTELDQEYQFKQFKRGECTAIRYYIQDDYWVYDDLHYEVRLGAVVDADFTLT